MNARKGVTRVEADHARKKALSGGDIFANDLLIALSANHDDFFSRLRAGYRTQINPAVLNRNCENGRPAAADEYFAGVETIEAVVQPDRNYAEYHSWPDVKGHALGEGVPAQRANLKQTACDSVECGPQAEL